MDALQEWGNGLALTSPRVCGVAVKRSSRQQGQQAAPGNAAASLHEKGKRRQHMQQS
jgi:hypothetical protein